jgi:LuxR family maltose regulon positive regulatory protein
MAYSTTALRPAAFNSFGELLRYLRRRQRLTQSELATAVGYSTAQISRLEQNMRLPNPSTLEALFVPALGLEEEPELATRLLALARQARDDRAAEAQMPDPQATGAATLADQEPGTPRHELPAHDSPVSAPVTGPGVQVLITKLYLPRPSPDLVARPHLLARLDAARHVPLTLLSAPAGFGKTTLLAEWIAGWRLQISDFQEANPNLQSPTCNLQSARVAWLSLDEGDNDPTTFLSYLIAAIQTIAPTLGSAALALLQMAQPPELETLLHGVLNDLTALGQECLLVLDDYHLIRTAAIHQALAFLVEHVPPTLHVILATRAEPPLPLARLRGRGQLLELRAADLRFTPVEAAAFLTDIMGLALNAAEVAALETRTEGWIAGLQLAALAMRERRDLASFISAFTGSQRFVRDYLVAEVFVSQPPHLQAFLLQTSILERMCGPLCDALMGVGGEGSEAGDAAASLGPRRETPARSAYSQLLLEQLERSNLFTIALDDERRWYRYHHLFGEALRTRLLSGTSAAAVARLHRRASAWYEGQGLVGEAVHHALTAQDWERPARLIEEGGLQLMLSGQMQTVLGWLGALPTAVVQRRPLLCIVYAVGLMLTNQAAAAEARLQDAENCLQPDTPNELARLVRGSVAGVRGRILYLAGDLVRAIDSLQQAMALLPETTTSAAVGITMAMARTGWAVYIATAYKVTGDVTAASEQRASDAIAPVRALGHKMATLNGHTSLATLQVLQGRLHTAATTYTEVERLVPGRDALQALSGSPSYYFGMGDLLREWNNLDAAEAYLARGMELIQGTLATEADTILRGYLTLARVQQARGNGAAALATLEAFNRLARERQFFPLLIELALALQARIRLQHGDLSAAQGWAEASGLALDDEASFPREAAQLTLVRVYIAAGSAAAVLPLLERMQVDAEANERMHSAIEILIVQALTYDATGDRQRALAALERALVLAASEGYIRVFIDEGAPLEALLAQSAECKAQNDPVVAYAEHLLSAFPSPTNLG